MKLDNFALFNRYIHYIINEYRPCKYVNRSTGVCEISRCNDKCNYICFLYREKYTDRSALICDRDMMYGREYEKK